MRRTERPVQTCFRYASAYRLKLARHTNSLTHYTKGTPSPSRAPTVCRQPVSGTVSLPLSGCFSPFPHGTCSLSVVGEYLGLEGGPPTFRQGFTCPALLEISPDFTRTGLSPAKARLSRRFRLVLEKYWPGPRSLATTSGVSVDVLSSGYLDVSVPRVRFESPMYSGINTPIDDLYPKPDLAAGLGVQIVGSGFPHSEIHGSKPVRGSPWLIAAYHVLHRLPTPRHPPIALQTLELLSLSLPPRRGNDDGKTRFPRDDISIALLAFPRIGDPKANDERTTRDDAIPSSRCSDNTTHGAQRSKTETVLFPDKPIDHAGGARRDRTDDLMLAKHALSQLSYGPAKRGNPGVVGLGRLELPTSRLSSARSNQLSYKPEARRPSRRRSRVASVCPEERETRTAGSPAPTYCSKENRGNGRARLGTSRVLP
jgi:hypothetical protein